MWLDILNKALTVALTAKPHICPQKIAPPSYYMFDWDAVFAVDRMSCESKLLEI